MEKKALFEIKASEGRGLGMFATQDIASGAKIFEEEALATITHDIPFTTDADIQKAFDAFTP